MKKSIITLVLLAFLLTSCNFPLMRATPDMNLVSTKVAATLSAAQTQSAPTMTPQVIVETPQPPSETPTIEPSLTTTSTHTATSPAGDPSLTLGDPGFYETFSSGTSFGLAEPYEDDAVKIEVKNGAMVFRSLNINRGMRWRLTSRDPLNLYLEGTFKTLNCSGVDQYGIVMRAPTYSDGIGYYFGATCGGQYYLMRWDAGGQKSIVNLTTDSNLYAGSNQTNRLGIMANGKTIRLYVNGKLVRELEDDGITAKGYIGAFSSAKEDPNFTVHMEELKMWTLP